MQTFTTGGGWLACPGVSVRKKGTVSNGGTVPIFLVYFATFAVGGSAKSRQTRSASAAVIVPS